jgi:hypothetical protein
MTELLEFLFWCILIVNAVEMFTCESPTQVYLFLIMTFARGQDIQRLRYLGYDRACDLHPFLVKLEKKGAFFAKWLNENVTFFVDNFHVAKHNVMNHTLESVAAKCQT